MRAWLFGKLEVEWSAEVAGATIIFATDLPGNQMTTRQSKLLGSTQGRNVTKIRLPGTTKGKLYRLEVVPVPTAVVRLYSARVWAKPLNAVGAGWQWYPVPIVPTSDAWLEAPLPIDPTPDAWLEARLPIEPTPDPWREAPLPIKQAPLGWEWVNFPVEEQ